MATDTDSPRQDIDLESSAKGGPEQRQSPELNPSESMELDNQDIDYNELPMKSQNNSTHETVYDDQTESNNGSVDTSETMDENIERKTGVKNKNDIAASKADPVEAPEEGEDLEDGEIDDDDDESAAAVVQEEVIQLEKSRKHRKSDSKDEELGSDGEERRSSKHKKHKSSRKDRSKRSLEKELKSDEEKKRLLKQKLRALELQMGNLFF